MSKFGENQKCFSRSGWWQTLCGLDAANNGFGWADNARYVGCEKCKALIKKGYHKEFDSTQILVELRKDELYRVELRYLWKPRASQALA